MNVLNLQNYQLCNMTFLKLFADTGLGILINIAHD